MALRLYTSNRLEILADALIKALKNPLKSVFSPEIIIVQSRGMERWISMQLATCNGICANYWFPFPNHFVKYLFSKILPEYDLKRLPDPEFMVWDIMELLPRMIGDPAFEELKEFIKGKAELRIFQLALKIAECFDHYQFYRPGMLLDWEKGKGNHWQAKLWREVSKKYDGIHFASLRETLLKRLQEGGHENQDLPERISIFGISFLPIFHMEITKAISRTVDVNLFFLNPCREYWEDISSFTEIIRRTKRLNLLSITPEDLHFETGNSLLASLGRAGREFLHIINYFEPDEELEMYEPPEEKRGLLFMIQDDILNLRDRTNPSYGKSSISSSDNSIQINSCHNPMREVEVLQNFLLYEFENDPELKPEDILVMCPDIDKYSPYIRAVFDISPDDPRWIPFNISDSSLRMRNIIAEPLMKILNIPNTRFEASAVLSILESPYIYRRFGISENDLELIRKYVNESGIRWGIDNEHKRQIGLPPVEENTWLWGLKRLILGYTMPEDEKEIFGDILPYNISGDDISTFEAFISFLHSLFETINRLSQKHPPEKWAEILLQVIDEFFLVDEKYQMELESIREAIIKLKNITSISDTKGKVGIETIRYYLGKILRKSFWSHSFLSNGITFCAMLPMRSIPFKIICLIGMDWDSFPRKDHAPGFDMIKNSPRIGDRSIKNEDKYIFLEAILSARKKLYISYVGQSMMDDTKISPSSVVSELIDYIKEGFLSDQGKDIEEHIITYQKQHPYHKHYFSGNRKLISFSEEAFNVAKSLTGQRKDSSPFIESPLPEPDESFKKIDIDDLKGFFKNPSRFFLKKRLGIELEDIYETKKDKEPFSLSGLDRYLVDQEVMKLRLSGTEPRDIHVNVKAKGLIPHGNMGKLLMDKIIHGVDHLINRMKAHTKETKEESIDVHLDIDDITIIGNIAPLFEKTSIHFRYAKIRASDLLSAWISHLVLNEISGDITTVVIGFDSDFKKIKEYKINPVSRPDSILERLIRRFKEGLKAPLRFFPESSYQYASHLKESEQKAISKARGEYFGSDYNRGESSDQYLKLCFGDTDPLDSEFIKISKEIYTPLLQHMKEA